MYTIYSISNKINNRVYVGVTKDTKSRWGDHNSALLRNDHHSYRLQEDWNNFGADTFGFSVLEEGVDFQDRYVKEQFWMDKLLSYEDGYNIAPTAGSCLGKKHREEAKRKMSASHKGKTIPLESREKTSKTMKGRAKTEEHQKKITESLRKRPKEIYSRGSNNGNAKLTEEDVIRIIERLDSGEVSTSIAKDYGVDHGTIYSIKNGKTWRHLTTNKGESA